MAIHKNSLTEISYDLIGDERSNRTLLCIHGAGGNMEALRALAEQFPDYKCILMDLPGHNLSGGAEPKSVSDFVTVIEKFIQSEKKLLGGNITCIGHSMGGCISMELALRKIPEIRQLIILNSGANITLNSNFMKKVRNGKIDKIYLYKCSGSYLHPRVLMFFLKSFKQMIKSQSVMIKDFLIVENYDLRNNVKNITLPTLIITGEKEILALPEYSKYLHSQIKGSQLFIMKKVAHLMPIVVPEKLSVHIRDFLNKNK